MNKRFVIRLAVLVLASNAVLAADPSLQQQVDALVQRVIVLEQQVRSLSGKDNWKDPVYWSRLKKEMPAADVTKLLGTPAHIEEQIFTTWYYHETSKLHSFVWFDEGKVLGWEIPD